MSFKDLTAKAAAAIKDQPAKTATPPAKENESKAADVWKAKLGRLLGHWSRSSNRDTLDPNPVSQKEFERSSIQTAENEGMPSRPEN